MRLAFIFCRRLKPDHSRCQTPDNPGTDFVASEQADQRPAGLALVFRRRGELDRLLAKLNARDRAQLVIAACQSGLAC